MASGKFDGSVRINTLFNTSGFKKGANEIEAGLKKIGTLLLSVFAVKSMADFGKQAIELASDLTEVQNVVDTAFGDMAYKIEEFANTSIENFGMSKLTAKQMASTFMAMANGMGQGLDIASDKAVELTGRLGDISSFYNKSMQEVETIGRAIYSGETEPLKQIGVIMTQDTLKAYALAEGYEKTYDQMSASEKLFVRQEYFLNATKQSAGDFVKTQDSWANQTKILSERWKEFQSVIGSGLITILTPAVKMLNNMVSAMITLGNTIGNVMSKVFGIKVQDVSNGVSSATSAYEGLTDQVEAYGNATEESAKKAKKAVSSLDDLNVITSSSSSDSGATSAPVGGGISGGAVTTQEDLGMMDQMLAKFAPLQKAIDDFKASLEPLKGFVAKGWTDFYNNFLEPLGNWTLGEALPRLVEGVANFNNSVDWAKLNGALAEFWSALEPFAENVGNGLLWFYENVLVPLGIWAYSDVVPAFLGILSGALDVVNQAITDLQPIWQWFWDNALKPIAEFVGDTFVDMLNGIGDALKWISDNEVAMAIVEGLALGITAVAIALGIYNGVVAIATAVSTAYGIVMGAINAPILIIIGAIGALIAVIVLCVKHWDEIKQATSKAIESMKNAVSAGIEKIKGFFTNIINFVKTNWQGLLLLLVNPFAGAFKLLYDNCSTFRNYVDNFGKAIAQIFKNIWASIKGTINGIIGGIESMANAVVSGINAMIRALNKLKWDVPDWVPVLGGKQFGFDIKEVSKISIPRLANGGITTGSTLANIGEAGREAVLPLEQNTEWMDMLADKLSSRMKTNVTFQVEGDPNGLFNVTRKQANEYYKRTGNNAFAY